MHAVYGFLAVRLAPSGVELFIEYDASRLSPKEVRASLEQNGLPLAHPAAGTEVLPDSNPVGG